MPPDGPATNRDAACLWDILQSARAVQEFTRGTSLDHYLQTRLLRRGVERELEIIGEAARRLSDSFRDGHPEIPWRQVIGLRNFLSHVYDAVEDERVWRIATEDVPTLLEQIERLVPIDEEATDTDP
jgi:uncharacterized protein with HEPN domain